MARIRIETPEKYIFSTTIAVRISDINLARHVSWNAMFGIIDEASVQFWASLAYLDEKPGTTSHITVDAGVNYKKQAFYGQTLKVEIGPHDFSSKGFDLVFRVTDAASGEEIAIAKAGILCYDYESQKVIQIPEALMKKLVD